MLKRSILALFLFVGLLAVGGVAKLAKGGQASEAFICCAFLILPSAMVAGGIAALLRIRAREPNHVGVALSFSDARRKFADNVPINYAIATLQCIVGAFLYYVFVRICVSS